MAMRSTEDGRRVYKREGSLLVTVGGVFYGPSGNKESSIDHEKDVHTTDLPKAGGKNRITVKQGKKSETWIEKKVVFKKRAA